MRLSFDLDVTGCFLGNDISQREPCFLPELGSQVSTLNALPLTAGYDVNTPPNKLETLLDQSTRSHEPTDGPRWLT